MKRKPSSQRLLPALLHHAYHGQFTRYHEGFFNETFEGTKWVSTYGHSKLSGSIGITSDTRVGTLRTWTALRYYLLLLVHLDACIHI